MTTPTGDLFSNIFSNTGWAIQKGVEAIKTDRIYYSTPLLLAGYTTYHSFSHLWTALRGHDSGDFRTKLRSDAFSTSGIKSIQLIARSIFGSISLYDRAIETGKGLSYLGVSTLLLYSMHSHIKDNSNNNLKFTSTGGDGEKEIFPDQHSHDINAQALKTYGQNEKYVNGTLIQPLTSKFSKGTQQAVEIADQAILPQDTPMGTYIKSARSTACSALNTLFGSPEDCAAPLTTETMNAQAIKEACEQTRNQLNELHPVDYAEKTASNIQSLCDWTWGKLPFISREGDCAGLKANLHTPDTAELTKRLDELDKVCEIVNQRAILQGRAGYSANDPEGNEAYKTLYQKTISPLTASSETIYTTIDKQGLRFKDFLEFSNNFPLSSKESDITKLSKYSETLQNIIPKDLDLLNSEDIPIFREAASSFLGISPGFSHKEFTKAYKNIQKIHHPDKSTEAISEHLFSITTQFNALFGKGRKNSIGYEYIFGSSLGTSIYSIPTPEKVITDLWESLSNWWSSPVF